MRWGEKGKGGERGLLLIVVHINVIFHLSSSGVSLFINTAWSGYYLGSSSNTL